MMGIVEGLKHFLQDRLLFILGYFISFSLIFLYYGLTTDTFDLLYPLVLILLIFIIMAGYDAYRYITFYKDIRKSVYNIQYELLPKTKEQHIVSSCIQDIHAYYLNEKYEMTNQSDEKERFITNWIHSLKTPVSVMALIVQQLKLDNEIENNAVVDMKKQIERMQHTLEELLSLTRLDYFSKDYEPVAVDLVQVVKRQIHLKKTQFIYEHLYPILRTPSGDEVQVLTDEKWSGVMISQILSNAIKYSNKQKKEAPIIMTIKRLNGKAVLTIEDEGTGIPTYDLPKVCEPFFTGKNGRNEIHATGIGLYICSNIADKLGHDLLIESEEGKGTKVHITYLAKM